MVWLPYRTSSVLEYYHLYCPECVFLITHTIFTGVGLDIIALL